METYKDWLAHHGILGMKWGKRNGPPYPLNEEDHSASEKKAGYKKSIDGGSYTKKLSRRALRKVEKEKIKAKKKEEKEKEEKEARLKDPNYVTSELKNRVDSDEHSSRISELKTKSQELIDESNEISKNILDDCKKYKITEEDKKWLMEQIKNDFGSFDQIDDEEFFEMMVDDYAHELLYKNVVFKKENGYDDFYKKQDAYWDALSELANDIAGDLSDKNAYNKYTYSISNGKKVVQELLADRTDSSFMSYMYKHFNDYWINDTDEFNESKNRIFEEVKKMKNSGHI